MLRQTKLTFIRQATIFNRHSYSLLQADEHGREGKKRHRPNIGQITPLNELWNLVLIFLHCGVSFRSEKRRGKVLQSGLTLLER